MPVAVGGAAGVRKAWQGFKIFVSVLFRDFSKRASYVTLSGVAGSAASLQDPVLIT